MGRWVVNNVWAGVCATCELTRHKLVAAVPLGGLVGDNIFLVPERVKRLAGRLHKWVALRRTPPQVRPRGWCWVRQQPMKQSDSSCYLLPRTAFLPTHPHPRSV